MTDKWMTVEEYAKKVFKTGCVCHVGPPYSYPVGTYCGYCKIKEALLSFAAQEVEKAKANRCDWCGSNDLVCGKAWKEEREKLLKENAEQVQEATEPLLEALYPLAQSLGELPMLRIDIHRARKALTAHRQKYPKEKS